MGANRGTAAGYFCRQCAGECALSLIKLKVLVRLHPFCSPQTPLYALQTPLTLICTFTQHVHLQQVSNAAPYGINDADWGAVPLTLKAKKVFNSIMTARAKGLPAGLGAVVAVACLPVSLLFTFYVYGMRMLIASDWCPKQ